MDMTINVPGVHCKSASDNCDNGGDGSEGDFGKDTEFNSIIETERNWIQIENSRFVWFDSSFRHRDVSKLN